MKTIDINNIETFISQADKRTIDGFLDIYFGYDSESHDGANRRNLIGKTGLAVIAALGVDFLGREGGGSAIDKIYRKRKNSPKP